MSHWIWNRELFISPPPPIVPAPGRCLFTTGINTHSNQRKSEAQISNSCKSLVADMGKHSSAPNFEITNTSISEHKGYHRAHLNTRGGKQSLCLSLKINPHPSCLQNAFWFVLHCGVARSIFFRNKGTVELVWIWPLVLCDAKYRGPRNRSVRLRDEFWVGWWNDNPVERRWQGSSLPAENFVKGKGDEAPWFSKCFSAKFSARESRFGVVVEDSFW